MSTIFFYTNRTALILNGAKNNLEYGSYAPARRRCSSTMRTSSNAGRDRQRWYVASEDEHADRLRDLVGASALHPIARAGGKTVYVNR